MNIENIKELEEIINKTGNYKSIDDLIANYTKMPNCIALKRNDLYEVFKSYHHHDLYEIIYIIKGNIDFFIEEKKYELTDGDMVLVAPNLLHKLVFTNKSECQRVIVNFTEEYTKQFLSDKTDVLNIFNLIHEKGMHKISFYPEKRKRLEKNFEEMEKYQFSDEFGSDLRFNINFAEFMLLVNRLYMNLPEEDLIQKNINDPYVTKTIEYINEHISEKIQLNDIANYLSLSVSRISHLFKDITGMSIMDYIIKKRLVLSKELLKNGEHIKTVYLKCGFPDEASFFRYFKQEYKITPKKYVLNARI